MVSLFCAVFAQMSLGGEEIMKRRLLSIILVCCLVSGMSACSSDSSDDAGTVAAEDTEETETEEEEVETEAAVSIYDLPDFDPADYIILDNYIGIEIPVADRTVTEEEYETALENLLSGYAQTEQITDRNTQEGDTIVVDYTGTYEGVAFDGGTAENQKIILGNGGFIDGFEEGFYDRPCGEEFVIDAYFPEDYDAEELAGLTVQFTCIVHYIEGDEIIPELTDDFVKGLEDYTCGTVEEFEEVYRQELAEQKAAYVDYLAMMEAWYMLLDDATFTGYPDGYVEAYEADMIAYYDYYASYYGYSVEEFMEAYYGMDSDTFYEEVEEYAVSQVQTEILYRYIAKMEDMEVTEEEYLDVVEYYMEQTGFTDMTTFVNYYGVDTVEAECYAEAMYEKVLQFVFDNAVEIPISEEEEDAEMEETEDFEETSDDETVIAED